MSMMDMYGHIIGQSLGGQLPGQVSQSALYGQGAIYGGTSRAIGREEFYNQPKRKMTKATLRIELQRETDDWLKDVL